MMELSKDTPSESTDESAEVLVYVHDPMCSWCYGFRPTWIALKASLPTTLPVVALVGGLAPDSDQPMASEMADMLEATWGRVQATCRVPFNTAYWRQSPHPPRSTYPACRAVIAAEQLAGRGEMMTARIQDAYYQEARNVWQDAVLVELAEDLGFRADSFAEALRSESVHAMHADQMGLATRLGVSGYPSLILIHEGHGLPIAIRHGAPDQMRIDLFDALGTSHQTH